VLGALYVAAVFMLLLDAVIVNVALPAIAADFGIAPVDAESVVLVYLVAIAVAMPVAGWLGDRLGARRVFLVALALFTLASLACGLSQSLTQLTIARAVQGLGGGMLQPLAMAMLMRVFPAAERIGILRVLAVPVTFGPLTAPILGGAIVDLASWHWIFLMNVPIGVAGVLVGARLLPDPPAEAPGRLDWRGYALAAGGLAVVMYALSAGSGRGWGQPAVLVAIAVGLPLLAAMVVVELRTREPVLDLRLFGDRFFRGAALARASAATGFVGALFVLPLYLQGARGTTALGSGLVIFPEAVGALVGLQVVPRVFRRIGPGRAMAGGLVGAATAVAAIALMPAGLPLWTLVPWTFLAGLAMSFVFVPSEATAFATVSSGAMARASSLFLTLHQVASALGVAILSSVLAATVAAGLAGAAPYRVALLVAAALTAAGALGAVPLLHDRIGAAEDDPPRDAHRPRPRRGPARRPRVRDVA
jgi:EmrB/QacA subfamily drug resistance transporter